MDAKVNFDENAAFRQTEVFSWRDTAEEDPREVAASAHNLNYIGMTGNIGCMGMHQLYSLRSVKIYAL